MKQQRHPEVADVEGAAYLKVLDEKLPCGTGRQTTWLDGNGVVLKQDYTVFVDAGVFADGAAQL